MSNPTLKVKVLPRFPSSVIVNSPITLSTTGGNYTFGFDSSALHPNLSNSTIDNTNSIVVKDANFTLQDDVDTTKQAAFQLSGITTGTTRTFTLPDASTTIVGAASPTFTGTVTAPIIASATTITFKTNGSTTAATLGTDQSLSTVGNATVGTVSPPSATIRMLTINGAASGSVCGSQINGNDGGTIAWGIGSYSTFIGPAYDGRLYLFSNGFGVVVNSSFRNISPTGGIGYGTGAGGAVTQLTSRTTGVTLNTVSGAITLFAAAPAVGTWVSCTVTNSAVAATDTVSVSVKSGTNTYIAHVTAVAAGSFQLSFTSIVGTSSDSPVINFNVIKGVTS